MTSPRRVGDRRAVNIEMARYCSGNHGVLRPCWDVRRSPTRGGARPLDGSPLAIGSQPRAPCIFRKRCRRSTLAAICLLSVLTFAGHAYCQAGRSTFPFVPWWMYGVAAESDVVTMYRTQGMTVSGETVSINPERLHPSYGLGRSRFANKIRHLASRMDRQNEIDPI